ncbi:quinol monooxygenase YgiN [Palleronia aestuarii]|uniref:Quinol monooxygenase YgiN n=1 Tax=Palleronia aestuarii TaxID=568105 RepID=A0A2W7N6P4_9RHOB|nr:putative quinol monooxygenase [Palleronia aestuarii]PZX15740.1 quinol monooxygenase YgiN [Palleronia aestuarii]
MSHLVIVADIRATPGQGDALETALRALVPPTLGEEGCVHYDLHRDNDDPDHFLFHEAWESRALWERHNASDHIAHHKSANAALVESTVIHEMTRIDG